MRVAFTKPAAKLNGNPRENLGADCGHNRLVSDIFHDLSQPLSTLTCLLEINLLLSRTTKQWRHDVKIALEQAQSIVRHLRALRELWEVGDEPQDPRILSVAVCLREVVADLMPMAKAAGVNLSLACSSGFSSSGCAVNFQESRLQQSLTRLLEFATESCRAGAGVQVTVGEEDDAVQVRVAISAAESFSKPANGDSAAESAKERRRELKRRQGLAVAWRIFETAGGRLETERSGDKLWIDLYLPLAPGTK